MGFDVFFAVEIRMQSRTRNCCEALGLLTDEKIGPVNTDGQLTQH